jgi:signal transduction histidine kinase
VSRLQTYRQGMSGALSGRPTPATADRLIAGGLALWALFDVPWWWRPPGHGGSNLAIFSLIALAAVQSVPFLWRRQRPDVVLGVTAAALAVKFAVHLNLWSASAAVLTAAYGLGAYGSRALRLAARVLVGAAVLAAIVTLQAIDGNHTAAIACALFGTALAVGEITAAHRDLITSLARQAYDEERASLAREVHDVVAHQLSAIAVQAGAARLAAQGNPQAAVTAVAAIEQGAREGLDELNTLVRRMRQADAAGPRPAAGQEGPGPVAGQDGLRPAAGREGLHQMSHPADAAPGPQPRLHDLPGLIERAKHAGLRAELRVEGEARPLADEIELAGYRVVQEGLTNAIRYAAGTAATVRLRYSATGLQVEVADEGPGQPVLPAAASDVSGRAGGGAGLAGLGERARLLGGQFEARRCQQGFVIRAFLPSPA